MLHEISDDIEHLTTAWKDYRQPPSVTRIISLKRELRRADGQGPEKIIQLSILQGIALCCQGKLDEASHCFNTANLTGDSDHIPSHFTDLIGYMEFNYRLCRFLLKSIEQSDGEQAQQSAKLFKSQGLAHEANVASLLGLRVLREYYTRRWRIEPIPAFIAEEAKTLKKRFRRSSRFERISSWLAGYCNYGGVDFKLEDLLC